MVGGAFHSCGDVRRQFRCNGASQQSRTSSCQRQASFLEGRERQSGEDAGGKAGARLLALREWVSGQAVLSPLSGHGLQ